MKMHMFTFALLLIGGLNWLLVGLFGWDIGQFFGGQAEIASRVIYVLVGLSAIWEIATHKANCKACCCMGGKCEAKCEAKMEEKKPM